MPKQSILGFEVDDFTWQEIMWDNEDKLKQHVGNHIDTAIEVDKLAKIRQKAKTSAKSAMSIFERQRALQQIFKNLQKHKDDTLFASLVLPSAMEDLKELGVNTTIEEIKTALGITA